MDAVLELVPHVARGSSTAGSDDQQTTALSGIASSLAATPAKSAPQTAIVDLLTKAGFPHEAASALAKASSAAAISAECPTAPLVILLAALAGLKQTGAEEQKHSAEEVTAKVERASKLVSAHFGVDDSKRLQGLVARLRAPATVITGVKKQTCVAGDSEAIVNSDAPLLIEGCDSATIYVTATVPAIILRRCRACTVVAVPASTYVHIADCSSCSITAAAPIVTASRAAACKLYVWSHAPVSVNAPSHDIAIGPYNAVADGLMGIESFQRWYVRGDCRFDASAGHMVRGIIPDEFTWKYLPLPQTNREHIVMPLAFSGHSLANCSPTVPSEAAGLTAQAAQSAEIRVQAAFVVRKLTAVNVFLEAL